MRHEAHDRQVVVVDRDAAVILAGGQAARSSMSAGSTFACCRRSCCSRTSRSRRRSCRPRCCSRPSRPRGRNRRWAACPPGSGARMPASTARKTSIGVDHQHVPVARARLFQNRQRRRPCLRIRAGSPVTLCACSNGSISAGSVWSHQTSAFSSCAYYDHSLHVSVERDVAEGHGDLDRGTRTRPSRSHYTRT
jgi:hypothetical protein